MRDSISNKPFRCIKIRVPFNQSQIHQEAWEVYLLQSEVQPGKYHLEAIAHFLYHPPNMPQESSLLFHICHCCHDSEGSQLFPTLQHPRSFGHTNFCPLCCLNSFLLPQYSECLQALPSIL
uniref:Uncharacterized protein n=1 Tax=Rhizophora mucronata TaxID=61149 RepID=A0A2P2LDV4_RHIMU